MRKYTPAEAIAVILYTFGTDQLPAITKDGKPTYKAVSTQREGSGCAASYVAKINPDFYDKLLKLGLHENASVEDLDKHDLDVNDIISMGASSASPVRLLQDLQTAHDVEGHVWFYSNDLPGRDAQFHKGIVDRLKTIAARYDILWEHVEAVKPGNLVL